MSDYQLKIDPLSEAKLRKLAKKIVDEGKIDRKLAKETYDFFRIRVENDDTDNDSKRCMVACLKLMQSSADKAVKLIGSLMKASGAKESGAKVYSELDFGDLLKNIDD